MAKSVRIGIVVFVVGLFLLPGPNAFGQEAGGRVLTKGNGRPDPSGLDATLRSVVAAEARKLAAESKQGDPVQNRFFWTGLGLMIGGGSLALLSNTVWAVDSYDDITCGVDDETFAVDCDTKVNKVMLFGGIGLAGVGGYLFLKGEREKSQASRTMIRPRVGGIEVRHMIRF